MEEKIEHLLLKNKESADFDLQMMDKIIKKHEEVRERAIHYSYQLIAVIGIVAGFGFTAMTSVKNVWFFILGESLFFSAILTGLNFIKKAFIDEAGIYAEYVKNFGEILDDRAKVFNLPEVKMEEKIMELNKRELSVFDEKSRDINSNFIFLMIQILFIAGGVFLLISFIGMRISG